MIVRENSDNKSTDIKKQEQTRRTELAMLSLLIEKYPREAKEKIRKIPLNATETFSESIGIQRSPMG